MTGADLGRRAQMTKQAVAAAEAGERHGTIGLDTLQRLADALECDVAYVFLPRTSLEDAVQQQARKQAARHLGWVSQQSRLEAQDVLDEEARAQLQEVADRLVDRRGLWGPR